EQLPSVVRASLGPTSRIPRSSRQGAGRINIRLLDASRSILMFRSILCAVVGLVILAGSPLTAEEIKGKIKSFDVKTGTVTVTVKDKDRQLPVAKDIQVLLASGKVLDKGIANEQFKAGIEVTIQTGKKKDGKEVIK